MDNFVAIDFETANFAQSSVCSVGMVIVKNGEKWQRSSVPFLPPLIAMPFLPLRRIISGPDCQ